MQLKIVKSQPDSAAAAAPTSQNSQSLTIIDLDEESESELQSSLRPIGPNILEHSMLTTCKLKGQTLLKLVPGRGWIKIKEMQNLIKARAVMTLNETAYLLGGAHDRNSLQTTS